VRTIVRPCPLTHGSAPRAAPIQGRGNADGTVDLALNSGLTVLLGTDKALHAKYEAVAAIIAGAPLHGAKTIDVTVPRSPTVSSS